MKKMRRLMSLLSLILVFAVIGTALTYVVLVNQSGTRWMNRSVNSRIDSARKTTIEGTVYDSAMTVLAESSVPGERHYISDKSARLALCHTIGDTEGQGANGVETRQATILLGLSDLTRTDYTLQKLMGNEPAGYDLVLTVNAELTKYIASLFPKNSKGACVIYNYKTGAILAKLSLPSYDPAAVDPATDADGSYYDRVLSYRYPPGSTFKIAVLASALQNLDGCAYEDFECAGEWTISNNTIHCAGNTAHGEMTLQEAFASSCNVTFATLAYRLGASTLKGTAEAFGCNREFVFDDLVLQPSHCLNGDLTSGEALQAGIGQGTTEITPLHMAMISGAIANGGVMMEPKLIREVRKHGGAAVETMESEVYTTVCDEALATTIARYMYAVVQSGTGTRAKISGYTAGKICGKTGSAEWSSDKTADTHAWYTGFLYGDDAHPYAIAVIVENAGSGGSVAAPIASKALAKCISMNLY